jgi:hydroxymethylpyrimidine/phosphomethylpyrimidine kinase
MRITHPLPAVLTIAGSDSGGGAGIQADLKTFAMLQTYGASVITALTAQNSLGVTGIEAPSPEFVALQLKTVNEDLTIRAAKTGMLFSREIMAAIAPILASCPFPLVVDPVCVAASGHKLLRDDAVATLIADIIPLATLLTPNRFEAELLSGQAIGDDASARKALDKLLALGAKAVLLKGGHFDTGDTVTDLLGRPGHAPLALAMPRVATANIHGTGCTLSAGIAAGLAKGLPLEDAIRRAQTYLNLALATSYAVGRGPGPANHSAPLLYPEQWTAAQQ